MQQEDRVLEITVFDALSLSGGQRDMLDADVRTSGGAGGTEINPKNEPFVLFG